LTFVRLNWHHFRLRWHYLQLYWHLLIELNKIFFVCLDSSKQHCLSSSHMKIFHLIFFYFLFIHSSSFSIMNLALSSEDLNFVYLKNLVRFINEHVDRENYAMILKRTKIFKEEIINKTWIICDRKRKTHVAKDQKRHDESKHIKCSFFIIIKLNKDIQIWLYEVKNAKHNHAFSVVDAHFALRKMTMTKQLQDNALINWQLSSVID
jgi:hypothetical protein